MVPSRQRFFSHPSPREQIEEEAFSRPLCKGSSNCKGHQFS